MSDLNENNMIWADSTSGRLLEAIDARIGAIGLRLDGLTVLTDARTEEDFVTILLAARAGARRIIAAAPARATVRSAQVEAMLRRLNAEQALDTEIEFVQGLTAEVADGVDIVAVERQSSLIKPALLALLPSTSVLAMLFDCRGAVSGGLDVRQRGAFELKVAGANLSDPETGVADYLAPLCLLQIEQAGASVAKSRCLLLCDNEMRPLLTRGLRDAGADVTIATSLAAVEAGPFDLLVLAMTPSREYRLDLSDVSRLPELLPTGIVIQFWGDIDRSAARYFAVDIWPPVHPGRGQMGIRLAALGSEPVVAIRAQALHSAVAALADDGDEAAPAAAPLMAATA